MHAAHRLFPRLLSLYAYNFLMNCPTKTIFGIKVILVIKKNVHTFTKSSKMWARQACLAFVGVRVGVALR